MKRLIMALSCAFVLIGCGQSAQPAPSTQPSGADASACAQQHNPLWGVRPLPLRSDPSITYDFTIEEDHFDACEPLSWAVLSGIAGPTFAKAVVFFAHGHIVIEPDPLLLQTLDGVERVDDRTLVVHYRGEESATFTLEDEVLVLQNNSLDPDAVFSVPRISLEQFKN